MSKALSKSDLVACLSSSCKPRQQWRIGTEHEKLGFVVADTSRPTYPQIRQLLSCLAERFGWEPVMEGGQVVGLHQHEGGASISLEPGGQLELSGAPLKSVHETCAELQRHLQQLGVVCKELGIDFLGVGFDPQWPLEEVPRMPMQRYEIILQPGHTPAKGPAGAAMVASSCTTQVNLDFESEADLVDKYRIGLSLQPVVTALFANSPFKDGKPSGYLSWRAKAWLDMDPTRSGALPFVFQPGFGFERYAEWALRCPMYFVRRGEVHLDARDQTFEDFMQCGLRGSPGVTATLEDWVAHLGTMWPVVRLKPACLEMRGADCGPWPLICALPALWVGLLCDPLAQQQALELVQGWSQEERDHLREEVPRLALRTPFRSGTVQLLAKQVLRISKGGLERRGLGEETYLQPLERIAESGVTQAERLLELYQTDWGYSIVPFYSKDFTTTSGGPGAPRL